MDLRKLEVNLSGNWREASRTGTKDSIYLRLYHLSPTAQVDSKIFQDQSRPSSDPKVSITQLAVPPVQKTLQDFYRGMKNFIMSGYAPAHMTLSWLDKLWQGMTKTPMVERPGDSDWAGGLSIANYQTEKIARQSFENIALMPTQGFDVSVPGGVHIAGKSENVTFSQLLKSKDYEKMISQYISKEQLAKVRQGIEKVQEQIETEVKPAFEKAGYGYKEGEYLNYPVVYAEWNNPSAPQKPKVSSKKKSRMGGGSDLRYDPLPKIPRPYSKTLVSYQALLVKNFIISGDLLWAISFIPSGNTPCYSLKKFQKKTETHKIGGETFTDILFAPVVSNYAQENYVHREELEAIIKSIIVALR
jgi:hypothetical protein